MKPTAYPYASMEEQRSYDFLSRANITPFGEQIVAEKTPIFELDSTSGISTARRDTITTTGSGSVTEASDGTIRVRSGTTTGSTAAIATKERGRYQSGIEALPTAGIYLTGTITGDTNIRWGYFTDNDGFWFGKDATGLYVQHLHNGTLEDKVYQADWNGRDKLDGNGASGLSINTSKMSIYRQPYIAYGSGPILFEVLVVDPDTGRAVREIVHRIGSLTEENIISQWKLPIQIDVDNGTTTDDVSAYVGGRAYFITGVYRPEPRLVPETLGSKAVGANATVPLISFQKKSDDKNTAKTVTISDAALFSDVDGFLKLYIDTTLDAGTTTFGALSEVSADETACEVNTAATGFSGGELIKAQPVKAASGNKPAIVDFSDIEQILPDDTVITLAFTNREGSSGTVTSVVFELKEEW